MELNEQLELLESYLVKQKHDLERKIDLIDDQKSIREEKCRRICLIEMRKMLTLLSDIDAKVTSDSVSEASNTIRQIELVEDEISDALESLMDKKGSNTKEAFEETLESIQTKVAKIDETNHIASLDFTVAKNSEELQTFTTNLVNSINIGTRFVGSSVDNASINCPKRSQPIIETSLWELETFPHEGKFISSSLRVESLQRLGLSFYI